MRSRVNDAVRAMRGPLRQRLLLGIAQGIAYDAGEASIPAALITAVGQAFAGGYLVRCDGRKHSSAMFESDASLRALLTHTSKIVMALTGQSGQDRFRAVYGALLACAQAGYMVRDDPQAL